MGLIGKAVRYLRENGARALLRRVARAVRHNDPYAVFCRDLDSGAQGDTSSSQIIMRAACPEDASWLASQWPACFSYVGPSVADVVSARLRAGEICAVGTAPGDHEHLIYMAWAAFRDFALLTVVGGAVSQADACAKNVWVSPEHRRKGIARIGYEYLSELVVARGGQRLWAFVRPGNEPSLRLHERMGFARYGDIKFRQRLARRSALVTTASEARLVDVPSEGAAVL